MRLLRRTVAPTVFPVTTAEAKEQAIVDFNDDNLLVDSLIETASRMVGEMAGRVLTAETWAISVPNGQSGPLALPKSPVQSVSSITYFDADDAEQTASVSDFYLIKDDDRALLRPKAGASWPSANGNRDDAITVTFVAGYSVCPANLKQAVLMLVAHLYEHREAAGKDGLSEVPFGVGAMIGIDRLGWVGA